MDDFRYRESYEIPEFLKIAFQLVLWLLLLLLNLV